MEEGHSIWLVHNEGSGSNDEESLEALLERFERQGYSIVGRTCFPDEKPPDAAWLKDNGIDMMAIFAGDGTLHSIVTGLFGWDGAVLPLPGGTMNMLSKRLHGAAEPDEIIERLTGRGYRRVRPSVLGHPRGTGLTGALAGPGTSWADVREAMRDHAIGEIAAKGLTAIRESVAGDYVYCTGLEHIRPSGYAAVSLVPEAEGIRALGFYAENPADHAAQLAAIVQGNFRDGPHDDLGLHQQIEIASAQDHAMGLLLDGEPMEGGARETFTLEQCGVDLIATDYTR